MKVIGDGEYFALCRACGIKYETDDPDSARMEARDHREWFPDHRPIARGPDNERLYG